MSETTKRKRGYDCGYEDGQRSTYVTLEGPGCSHTLIRGVGAVGSIHCPIDIEQIINGKRLHFADSLDWTITIRADDE